MIILVHVLEKEPEINAFPVSSTELIGCLCDVNSEVRTGSNMSITSAWHEAVIFFLQTKEWTEPVPVGLVSLFVLQPCVVKDGPGIFLSYG
jgi:hypothetical protein